jgi:hypothetical protein
MTPSTRSLACVPPSNVPARGSIDTVGGISSASPEWCYPPLKNLRNVPFFFSLLLYCLTFLSSFFLCQFKIQRRNGERLQEKMLTIPLVVPESMLQWAAQRGFIEFEYEGVADNRVPVAVV